MPFIIAKTVTYVSSLTVTYVTTLYIPAARNATEPRAWLNGMQSVPIVGEALSLPPRYETACLVEWYHVRHSTNSPELIRDCGFVPRGRLRASPTVSSRCGGNSPNPVHHFWLVPHGRLVVAPTKQLYKLQFSEPNNPHISIRRHCHA